METVIQKQNKYNTRTNGTYIWYLMYKNNFLLDDQQNIIWRKYLSLHVVYAWKAVRENTCVLLLLTTLWDQVYQWAEDPDSHCFHHAMERGTGLVGHLNTFVGYVFMCCIIACKWTVPTSKRIVSYSFWTLTFSSMWWCTEFSDFHTARHPLLILCMSTWLITFKLPSAFRLKDWQTTVRPVKVWCTIWDELFGRSTWIRIKIKLSGLVIMTDYYSGIVYSSTYVCEN